MVYALAHEYLGQNWVNDFSWIAMRDNLGGTTEYLDLPNAQAAKLYSVDPNTQQFNFTTDMTSTFNTDSSLDRRSLNITSTRSFRHGLFVFDVAKWPQPTCSVWPALWFVDANDASRVVFTLVNYMNRRRFNTYALFPYAACNAEPRRTQNNAAMYAYKRGDCMADDPGSGAQAGACFYSSYASWDPDHGGYVALAITSNYVKMWAFSRNNPPGDLLGASPNPDAWSTDNLVGLLDSPACPIDTAFPTAIKIQLHINYCGGGINTQSIDNWLTGAGQNYALANGTYAQPAACDTSQTCNQFAATGINTQSNLDWLINRARVYQDTSDTLAADNARCANPDVQPGSIGNSSSLGCYKSVNSFNGMTLTSVDENMTPNNCVNICNTANQPYAGVDPRGCWCGTSISRNQ